GSPVPAHSPSRPPLRTASSSPSRTTTPPPSNMGRSGIDQGRKRTRDEFGSPSTARQPNTAPQHTTPPSRLSARRLFSEVAKASAPPSSPLAQPHVPFRKVLGTATFESNSFVRRSIRFPDLKGHVAYLRVAEPEIWGDPVVLRACLMGVPNAI